jgi:phosphoribosylglycinamide formyltransferase-1
MMAQKLPIAVLISGSGSNLQALIDACQTPDYPAEIRLVLSNKADAYGLERARAAGIPTQVLSHRDFADREAFDAAIHQALTEARVKLVCLAGFMRLLTPGFVQQWHDRLINIHPSLLPLFKGLHTHRQALECGMKVAGCTVHFVRAEMDVGPIIAQAAVPVLENDSEESLAKRVLVEEHRIYPQAVRWFAEGRLRVAGERVSILPTT